MAIPPDRGPFARGCIAAPLSLCRPYRMAPHFLKKSS